MKIERVSGTWFLVGHGHRVTLSESEADRFRRMTPLGRKITLRKRALEQMALDPEDSEARHIIALFRLPAREWSFSVPD